MKIKKTIPILIITVSIFLSSIIDAKVSYSFSCSGKSVKPGDTTYSILKRCGEPAYREVISSGNKGCEKIEKWHYDCTKRKNIVILIFKKGILVERIKGERTQGVQDCR